MSNNEIINDKDYEHKLGQSTIKAMSILCDKTAEEIEATATTLMTAAEEVCRQLKDVAAEMRKSGECANARVSEFINMSASVVETARSLKTSIEAHIEAQS